MIIRKEPDQKYESYPCSLTAVHAYLGSQIKLDGEFLNEQGYCSLYHFNCLLNLNNISFTYRYFTKKSRVLLSDLLKNNKSSMFVCVEGHFIYVQGETYYSFFDNLNDKVVAIWQIK